MDQTQASYAMMIMPAAMVLGAIVIYWLFD
jgi:hypothetical protein